MRTIKLNGKQTPLIKSTMRTDTNGPLPDAVHLALEFPDMRVKWMRPVADIPGDKTFTPKDVVEIDRLLHIHLRDGRDIGAGGIEPLSTSERLANELEAARLLPPAPAISKRQRSQKQKAGSVTGNKLKCGSQEDVKKTVSLARRLMKAPSRYTTKKACEQALRQAVKDGTPLYFKNGWRGLRYHVDKGHPAK